MVDDNTPANDRNAVELTMMSDVVIDYEKEHYPIGEHRQPTVFNPAQLYLLRVFSHIKSDEELNDIKQLVSDYYAKRLDRHLDKLWEDGILDQKRLDEINEMDLHQWLREEKAKEQVAILLSPISF